MTEKEIQQVLNMSMDWRETPFRISNAFVYSWESDYWTIDARGITREYEIKISMADYRRDAAKEKHQYLGIQGPNFFYYVCPEGLIPPEAVDKKYGLIYVKSRHHLYLEKRPKRLHSLSFDNWKTVAEKSYYRWRTLAFKELKQGNISNDEYYNAFDLSYENDTMDIITEIKEGVQGMNLDPVTALLFEQNWLRKRQGKPSSMSTEQYEEITERLLRIDNSLEELGNKTFSLS